MYLIRDSEFLFDLVNSPNTETGMVSALNRFLLRLKKWKHLVICMIGKPNSADINSCFCLFHILYNTNSLDIYSLFSCSVIQLSSLYKFSCFRPCGNVIKYFIWEIDIHVYWNSIGLLLVKTLIYVNISLWDGTLYERMLLYLFTNFS